MDEESSALRSALETDPQLAGRFAAATSEDEVRAIAAELGIDLSAKPGGEPDESAVPTELSDIELLSVAGAGPMSFIPRTDWIYCNNPYTNIMLCTAWC